MQWRRVASEAPRHALIEDVDDESGGHDEAAGIEPRHSSPARLSGRNLKVLLVPTLVATLITGAVIAFKPAPTTAAEPLAQTSTAASATPGSEVSATPSVEISVSATPSEAPSGSVSATASTTPSPSAKASASASPKASAASAAPKSTPSADRKAKAVATRWTTTAVNVRASASTSSKVLKTLAPGSTVAITSNTSKGFQQVVWNDSTAWVTAKYLASKKPKVSSNNNSGGGSISAAPCKSGSRVEAGLVRNGIAVHRAVCAKFPFVTRYIGRGGGGNHAAGRALDIMVSGESGWAIANWLRANAYRLGITEVIYSQRIWTTQRSREGWRYMSNRGSATANHYDHVHVTVR